MGDVIPLSCIDFPEANTCCVSCHEDEDLGFSPLSESYADWELKTPTDKRYALICCGVDNSINWKDPKVWFRASKRQRERLE